MSTIETMPLILTRRHLLALLSATVGIKAIPAWAADVGDIAPQPYFAAVNRALEALAKLGAPVASADAQRIAILTGEGTSAAIAAAESILDRYTLMRVRTDSDGIAWAEPGGARRVLIEQGWSLYLVRVFNPIGSTARLLGVFDGAQSVTNVSRFSGAQRPSLPETVNVAPRIEKAWLAAENFDDVPLAPMLSGFPVEYRIIQLISRDRGERSAKFSFMTAGDPLVSFFFPPARAVTLSFTCLPSRDVTFGVRDVDGRGCMASFIIKDKLGRLYPLQAMRLAPDLRFQPQIYRADGETVRLPDGTYTVASWRGPEYVRVVQSVTVDEQRERIDVQLKRWIDPAQWGWYSGDTHIHAAGCAHYEQPTQGVSPQTIIRQVRGEALSIGDVLTWGPGYYYQKQFFTGRAESPEAGLEQPALQAANHTTLRPKPTPKDAESLIRYDVEVSGFPSSHAGHLVLLRLTDQQYPGAREVNDWPSWNLPILQWARAQGAVVGYAHCGDGMVVGSQDLPNYDIPAFARDGAHESIVDVTHGVVDFLSGCEMPPITELNMWYHMLNCGFRLGMAGETDFPCMSDGGQRPGVGRSYVRLARRPSDDSGYNDWVGNLKKGRHYHGDGRSHFLEFEVDGHASGDEDVEHATRATVKVRATVAAWLEPEVTPETEAIRTNPFSLPCWHIERSRVGNTRDIDVELIVNGNVVERSRITADGTPRAVHFRTAITRSAWVALRVLFSGHTHPVFVKIGGKSIRASRRSAQWCRTCVDEVWARKSLFIRDSERPAAAQAFDHARDTYDAIIAECEVE